MSTTTDTNSTDAIPVFVQEIELSGIRTDGGTQVRVSISRNTFLDYRDKMLEGVEFPPVVLFWGPGGDGESAYWLADGFHRFYGAREAKLTKISAIVHQGTGADAMLFAAGANSTHGLKLSDEDKRNTVLMLLKDKKWGKKSANWIAEKCGFFNSFVSKVRAEFESTLLEKGCDAEPPRYEGRDGKKRKLPSRKSAKAGPVQDEQVIIPMVAAVQDVEPLSDAEQRRLQELEGVIATNIDAVRQDGPCPHGGDHLPDADGDCKRCFEPGVAPAQPIERRGKGVILANEAINCLIRIPKNDALRERGLQIVADWIAANGEARA